MSSISNRTGYCSVTVPSVSDIDPSNRPDILPSTDSSTVACLPVSSASWETNTLKVALSTQTLSRSSDWESGGTASSAFAGSCKAMLAASRHIDSILGNRITAFTLAFLGGSNTAPIFTRTTRTVCINDARCTQRTYAGVTDYELARRLRVRTTPRAGITSPNEVGAQHPSSSTCSCTTPENKKASLTRLARPSASNELPLLISEGP